MIKLSDAASSFLARVKRLGRAFTPRLEPHHLELMQAKMVGYFVPHSGGFWIYMKDKSNDKTSGKPTQIKDQKS